MATHQQTPASKSDLDALRADTNCRFDGVDRRFDAVESALDALRTDADRRFEAVDHRFDLLSLELRRLDVRFRNSRLKNPFQRIEPAPGFDLQTGIAYPDPKLFPRNARAFYALRDPTTDHQRQVLEHLQSFYELRRGPVDGGGSDDDDDDDDKAFASAGTPEHTVDELQAILGLEEDKFIKFKERAEKFGANAPATTGKHPHVAPDAGGDRQRQRVQTAVNPLSVYPRQRVFMQQQVQTAVSSPAASFSDAGREWMQQRRGVQTAPVPPPPAEDDFLEYPPITWGDRSTPESQRLTIQGLHAALAIHHPPPCEPSDGTSPTNAVSTPPGFLRDTAGGVAD
ncbi:hypothetical protein GGTG_04715 [Gaeumannomyces tritici R3-111a-1]|uniref:Uncharacterized protein n=1 Tax=Gaeumannomyces tritici (strain R3-111a-1) TaxID=644352 RepID=J3NTW6_GAET3|nr:hypothetical protein GGTG_04715 [Gaeumannomyces tritici R3-111a-1]EJT79631.1 hypothetical protein GGTG_04715 [Gaeumannomyces tritici R3-111a-1]